MKLVESNKGCDIVLSYSTYNSKLPKLSGLGETRSQLLFTLFGVQETGSRWSRLWVVSNLPERPQRPFVILQL